VDIFLSSKHSSPPLRETYSSSFQCLSYSALIVGGGAPEIEVSRQLSQYAQTLKGMEAYCFQAYAEALEVIPTTLAENAGLNPISIVTELRNRHALGEKTAGINVRKGLISDIREENVLQPLLVSTSAVELATETVGLLLKIDDYSPVGPEFLSLDLHTAY
jgi:T-complex protein 1 subunit delta